MIRSEIGGYVGTVLEFVFCSFFFGGEFLALGNGVKPQAQDTQKARCSWWELAYGISLCEMSMESVQ